jgi:hypothetical protein
VRLRERACARLRVCVLGSQACGAGLRRARFPACSSVRVCVRVRACVLGCSLMFGFVTVVSLLHVCACVSVSV